MEVSKRIYLIHIAEKIERNKKYADKIGTKNISKIRTGQKKKQEEQ